MPEKETCFSDIFKSTNWPKDLLTLVMVYTGDRALLDTTGCKLVVEAWKSTTSLLRFTIIPSPQLPYEQQLECVFSRVMDFASTSELSGFTCEQNIKGRSPLALAPIAEAPMMQTLLEESDRALLLMFKKIASQIPAAKTFRIEEGIVGSLCLEKAALARRWMEEHAHTLTKIKRLDLSNKQLKVLPVELGLLTGVKELILSSNQLSTFPSSLQHLTLITRLDLRNNRFTSLPPFLARRTLTALFLNGNPISALHDAFNCCSKVKHSDAKAFKLLVELAKRLSKV